ncbi:MAG: tRNA-dihydrouridine synthase family protein [Spirochaetes bacterium]|nr:tRNA-dihydrouridine synthase family protein [Spirochaetota bacterium]
MHKKLPSSFFMAPLAEITNAAFRKTVRKFSSDVILHSEMLSAASVLRGGMKNPHMMIKNDSDNPFVYQLLGNDPSDMSEACRRLASDESCLGIDVNMGCSAPDIIKKNSGSLLLMKDNFELSLQIIRQCRRSLPSCNLSVKMRCGYPDYDPDHLLKFCRMLEDEGVDYLTLHPRTGRQAFKRTADWRIVSYLKNELHIPVIGNGDVKSAENAFSRLSEVKCDGIMIGRQAVQQPWIFLLCSGRKEVEVDLQTVAEETLFELERTLPAEYHKSRMHRFLAYYVKNLKYGHSIFPRIRKSSTASEMAAVLEDYFLSNGDERFPVFTQSGKRKD